MINLLPSELKTSYHYGRRNVGLRRWIVAFTFALVGLGIITTFGLVSIRQATASAQKQISGSQLVLQRDNLAGTQKQIQDISGNFKLVVKVLGQEILFSKLLQQIGAAMPTGSELTGLTIQNTTGGLDIVARATNYQAATQVQVNLADASNKIFSKADIVNITCKTDPSNPTPFPCTVQLRALFASNNPFLFINSSNKAKP